MKHTISEFAKKPVYKVMHILRRLYRILRRRRLTNTTPTIISSDCFGGVVSHDLGLQFRSPTVNLCFTHEDFIVFVRDLPGFLNAELTNAPDPAVAYPVGALEYGGRTVHVRFMHYQSFEQAKEKWNRRRQRVDYSNLYIIQTVPAATVEKLRAFDALPYPNKLLITDRNLINSPCVRTHPVFRKPDYRHGEILEYKSDLSIRRHVDRIDYVSFLNRTD